MKVAVIGGKLQGVEAVYLSKKAGWEVTLVDKDSNAPAVLLCDHFYKADILKETELDEIFKDIQFIIPALENDKVLNLLNKYALNAKIPILYDAGAYSISSSKIISDKLFAELKIPVPRPWPGCEFPVVVKPSELSGSEGVHKIENKFQLDRFIEKNNGTDNLVIQEFLEGPSYSLEVIGYRGNYRVLQVTELNMDKIYDCKRVIAPSKLDRDKVKQFEEISIKIAKKLDLTGIFDVEVILNQGEMKVLEIDARLPSQTPTAVYNSTGVNLLECLWYIYSKDNRFDSFSVNENGSTIYEHIKVKEDFVEVCGEHIMAKAGKLKFYKNFFGADEAISNYDEGKKEWSATLIINGKSRAETWNKRCCIINNIKRKYQKLEEKRRCIR
jgi:pyrrolysine biosynthesis protein PylC